MRVRTFLAFSALAAPLAAQNWITNGDFTNGLVGWSQTGTAYNPVLETWDTTGYLGQSQCFACSPAATPHSLDQSNVVLATGLTYEVSADLTCTVVQSLLTVLDVITITAEVNGNTVATMKFGTLMSPPLPKEWKARLSGRFTPTTSGPQPVSFKFGRQFPASATTPRVRIDNITLQITSGPTFAFDAPRRINKGLNLLTSGAANAPYAVFCAAGALGTGLNFGGIVGTWFLDPVTTVVLLQGTLDASGQSIFGITVPNDPNLIAAPLFYQPAHVVSGTVHLGLHHGAVFTQ